MNSPILFGTARVVCALSILVWTSTAHTQDIQSSPAQAQAWYIGQQALVNRDFNFALHVAQQLVELYPQSSSGYLIRSSAYAAKGEAGASHKAAQKAQQLARSDFENYSAALALGTAHTNLSNGLLAQYWLRKSANFASDPSQKRLIKTLLANAKAKSPWQTRLSFGIAPYSNINNGSSAQEILINDLVFILNADAKPISGWGLNYGLGLSYLKRLPSKRQTRWNANISGVAYHISPDAEQGEKGVRGSNYNYTNLSVGVEFLFSAIEPRAFLKNADLSFSLSKDWYGLDPLANTVAIGFGKAFAFGDKSRARLGFGYEMRSRQDSGDRSSEAASVSFDVRRRIDANRFMIISNSITDRTSASPEIANESWQIAATHYWNNPSWRVAPSLTLGYRHALFDLPSFGAGRRRDHRYTAGISVILKELTYYGFSPKIDLQLTRTESSHVLYDSTSQNLRLGFISSF